MSDLPPSKRAKFVSRDHQRKIRLAHIGRALDGLLPVPEVCVLVKEYANEFDGIKLLTRSGRIPFLYHMASLAVLNDGSLAYTSQSKVVVWDADQNVAKMELVGHTLEVSALLALDGHKLASGSADSTVRVWDFSTGECLFVRSGHGSKVGAMTLLEDGTIASNSDRCILVWDANTGALLKNIDSATLNYARAVRLSNGLMAFASCSNVSVFDLKTGKRVHRLEGHLYFDMSVCALPNDRLASAAMGGSVWIWDNLVHDSAVMTPLSGHTANVRAMISLPDGRLVTGSNDTTVRVWNTQNATCLLTLSGHTKEVAALILLPDGRLASSSSDRTLRVWDLVTGECTLTIKTDSCVSRLAVLPGCKLVGAGHYDDTIYIWG